MKKILLTGASGYVGQNFFDAYKEKYQIQTFSLQKESLDDLDLSAIDTVLHCAALVHQKQPYSQEIYDCINKDYSYKLASKAKRDGVKQFVFLSTIAVYGENKNLLTEETLCHPSTLYGKSKLKAEQKLQLLNDANFIISVIRLPMVYGYNALGNIKSLINLIKKIPVLPFGSINNKRTFVYIGNLCHLIDVIIDQQKEGIFLAGDDRALSTSEFIKLIAENLNKKVHLIKIPFFETALKLFKPDLHRRLYGNLVIDNTGTKKMLNFENPYSVEEGIKLMIG